MSSVYEQEIEDGVFEDVGSPCVALVPATPTVYCAAKFALPRRGDLDHHSADRCAHEHAFVERQ